MSGGWGVLADMGLTSRTDEHRTIRCVLVANRGEIARRVFATCRRLDIATVAVHSDADAGLPFVAEADRAVRLPGDAPADTYLRGDLIVDAALRAGADAIHPGYGFLSENADFARAVVAAGLTWIGPPPDAIEAMGSKIEAKRLMAKAGVPVLEAPADPTEDDLPLLVKASAGGGGRGMRVVRSLTDLDREIEAAAAEAASAFGDGTVFVEPYVERGRHVEVQIWGDHTGQNISVLGARDCSVQRRHQKVVEEAPPPGVDDVTLLAMYDAARAAGEAIGYTGAGTVEFLLDAADLAARDAVDDVSRPARFWFLEMNTRLQVEHPVTELVTGLDLVELQLRAAVDTGGGTKFGFTGDPRRADGHAIEVRLYAEDPAADYAPQVGRLATLEIPGVDVEFGPLSRPGLRLDAGFASGSEVTPHYDAMLAKVVSWAPSRQEAVARLTAALAGARIHGVRTNRDQLVQILRDPAFTDDEAATLPDLHTGFLDTRPASSPALDPLAVTAAGLMLAADDAARRTVQGGIPAGWRNVPSQPQRVVLDVDGEAHSVEWYGTRDGLVPADESIRMLDVSADRVRLEVDGVATSWRGVITVDPRSRSRVVYVDGPGSRVSCREVPRFVDPADAVASGSLLAPMPGTVVNVVAETGASIVAGDPLVVLEAMKMQHTIAAPHDGTVTEIHVEAGAQVAAGEVLAVVSTEPVH